jgi:hypothetical protein
MCRKHAEDAADVNRGHKARIPYSQMSIGLGHMFSCLMLSRLGGLLDEIALPINCAVAGLP